MFQFEKHLGNILNKNKTSTLNFPVSFQGAEGALAQGSVYARTATAGDDIEPFIEN